MTLSMVRLLFVIAGLYDFVIGLTFLFFGAQLFDAAGVPQPMHWAASKAASASGLGMSISFASGALPELTEIYPPEVMMRSKELRSTTKSLITGKAAARQGSTVMVEPEGKFRM